MLTSALPRFVVCADAQPMNGPFKEVVNLASVVRQFSDRLLEKAVSHIGTPNKKPREKKQEDDEEE